MEIERTGTWRTAEGIVTKKGALSRGVVRCPEETCQREEKRQKGGTGARKGIQRKMGVNIRAMSIRRVHVQGDCIVMMSWMSLWTPAAVLGAYRSIMREQYGRLVSASTVIHDTMRDG